MRNKNAHTACEARTRVPHTGVIAGWRAALTSLAAIVGMASLSVPMFAGAFQLEDIKNTFKQAVSDTARKQIESGKQQVDSLLTDGAKTGGPPSQSSQANGNQQAADATGGAAAAGASTPTQCVSSQAQSQGSTRFTNTCAQHIWILYRLPDKGCYQVSLKPAKFAVLTSATEVLVACRRNATVIPPGTCDCPSGTQL